MVLTAVGCGGKGWLRGRVMAKTVWGIARFPGFGSKEDE